MQKLISFATVSVLLALMWTPDARSIPLQGTGCVIVQFDHPERGTVRTAILIPKNGDLPLPNVPEVYLYTLDERGGLIMTGGSTVALARDAAENPLPVSGSCSALWTILDLETD